jgi:hypothetical protein
MAIFDIWPKRIRDIDIQQAQAELDAMEQDRIRKADSLLTEQVIRESVERQVREELATTKHSNPVAANLDWLDPVLMVDPAVQGTQHPGTRGAAMSFEILRGMAAVPVIDGIITTRLSQLAPFTRRMRNHNEPSFYVRMRDRGKPPSTAARKKIAALEAWIETCGDPMAQEDPTFETFVAKIMRDSLTLDQACAEILLDKKGNPAAMIPVDAATIRYALPSEKEMLAGRRSTLERKYIQVLNTKKVAEWEPERFMFGIRRPRTDLNSNFYGWPELEVIARNVNYLLQAEFYNAANFTNGMHASGIIAIMSAMDKHAFYQLDMKMRQALSGAHNAHRTMFLQLNPNEKEDIKPIQFSQTNKDMEFSNWVSWLLKIVAGAYQMDPAEINFIYGNENQRSTLGNVDAQDRISASKERGLPILLSKLASWLNRKVIYRLDPDFELAFNGFDEKNPLTQADLDERMLRTSISLNELRAQQDRPTLGDHWIFNTPLNPVAVNVLSQEQARKEQQEQEEKQAAMQQQQQGQGQPGDEGEPPNPPEELPDQYKPTGERDALPEGVSLDDALGGKPEGGEEPSEDEEPEEGEQVSKSIKDGVMIVVEV